MPPRERRLAAGRARALGLPTRGTTTPNRLRRVDRWLVGTRSEVLRAAADPLVVDLGYGASPVTTVELYARLRAVRPDVRVVGLELDPARVAAGVAVARPPGLTFGRGGFELAGHRPVLVRAMNVLRQYDETAVAGAWRTMADRLAPGGLLVEGTCDEIGRRACWLSVSPGGQPVTLTLAARLAGLGRPSDLAERLPKALISRNVPGEPVGDLMRGLDRAWAAAAPYAVYGPRQRWRVTVETLALEGRTLDSGAAGGWQVLDDRRWRFGELTLRWPPAGGRSLSVG